MNEKLRVSFDSAICAGCNACYSVCPVGAIKMMPDQEGFLNPVVNEEMCIHCHRCENSCPNNHPAKQDEAINYYAFINKDNNSLSHSSSGGFFPVLAKWIIEQHGVVCGCVLDENNNVIHKIIRENKDISLMQDSKYVQSDMDDCIKIIIESLKNNQYVGFFGTSCQVAGVKNAVKVMNVSDEKLICIDFICHGVPSPKIWKSYLKFYEEKKKRRVTGFRFRCKQFGWGKASRGTYHLNTVYSNDEMDNFSLEARMWYYIFFSNLCIRKYCHACPYASQSKPGDFTMADFWGVEDEYPNLDASKGVSLVITRSNKAESILGKLRNVILLKTREKAALAKQLNSFRPTAYNLKREEFWAGYNKYGFEYVANKYFRYDILHKVRDFVVRLLFHCHLRNLYK